jgi:hypothetical protein
MPQRPRIRPIRSHFTLGVVLLLVGGLLLAENLGVNIHRYVWEYWPFMLMAIGVLQLAWPANWSTRLGGYWLVVVGAWGAINIYEWFGLHWGNSWPIFIIALGIRVILGALLRAREPNDAASPVDSSHSNTKGPTP